MTQRARQGAKAPILHVHSLSSRNGRNIIYQVSSTRLVTSIANITEPKVVYLLEFPQRRASWLHSTEESALRCHIRNLLLHLDRLQNVRWTLCDKISLQRRRKPAITATSRGTFIILQSKPFLHVVHMSTVSTAAHGPRLRRVS
jgi:hypothetical protein